MFKTMFYIKNVPIWERTLRVALGLILTLYVIFGHPASSVIILSLVSAVFVIVTGFIGWCPMCALVGRKIKTK
jgi:uncharacterized membrane protein HdeD (DUF308 family)